MLARSRPTVDAALAALADAPAESLGLTADVTDERVLRTALDEAVARLGVPGRPRLQRRADPVGRGGRAHRRQHLDAWAVNVVGAITAVAHLGAGHGRGGPGTILITGGMPEPLPDVTSLSLGKAGVRALAELLARAYEPAGIHVATVTVAGAVAPGTAFDPDDIAEEYWRLTRSPRARGSARCSIPGAPDARRRRGDRPEAAAPGARRRGGTARPRPPLSRR